jgi:hypothetical protein
VIIIIIAATTTAGDKGSASHRVAVQETGPANRGGCTRVIVFMVGSFLLLPGRRFCE